jgi:hypothetical protein
LKTTEPNFVSATSAGASDQPWWRELNRYHWFVLLVTAMGWLFDCLDQQLFNLARVPAMKALLQPGQSVAEYGGYATAIFLIGWASGGLTFGVLGDRIGRAKTMMITILIYSLCTGLSALRLLPLHHRPGRRGRIRGGRGSSRGGDAAPREASRPCAAASTLGHRKYFRGAH